MSTDTTEAGAAVATVTLDDLEAMTRSELDAVFDEGATPPAGELDGEYSGRVLTGPVFPLDDSDVATSVAMALVNNPTNPWKGKRFEPDGEARGEGVNLLGFGPLAAEVLRFDYHRADCLQGDGDCVLLDYDVPANPPGARRIRDEIRRVGEGSYLGRLYLEGDDATHFVLYWALAR